MKQIKIICILLMILLGIQIVKAEVKPVEGISPSGTLPILYINTVNSTPIDQKDTYIDAEYWLECHGYKNFEDIGSMSSPQKLGIRGRGNTTWRHDGQKPYKMKLDKKTSIMGMGKNKHWALLARLKYFELYNELLAFEMGRKLDMPFVPQIRPVEVVLNGTYVGLYMLTETIRIDDNRLEIDEQPDGNEDIEILDGGWLVEMDNNKEEVQISIPLHDKRDLLITPHTPEVLSSLQYNWVQDQFEQIVDYIYRKNNLDDSWEELIDVESLAKHMIIEELLHNFDGYQGSCYLHKDTGEKWKFGPLWDFSACWVYKADLLAHHEDQLLIGELIKFPSLRKKAREILDAYVDQIGNAWVQPFLTDFYNEIKSAVETSVKVWPDVPLDAKQGLEWCLNTNKYNLKFLQDYYNENWITHEITVDFTSMNPTRQELAGTDGDNLFSVTMNGILRKSADVNSGDTVEMEIKPKAEGIGISAIYVNGASVQVATQKATTIKLNNISNDMNISVVYSDIDNSSIEDVEIPLDYQYFDLNGRKVNIEDASKGIYIRSDGKKIIK